MKRGNFSRQGKRPRHFEVVMDIFSFCAGAVVTLVLLAVLVGYSALVVAGKADESAGDK